MPSHKAGVRTTWIIALLAGSLAAQVSACPGFLDSKALTPMPGGTRASLRLFTRQKTDDTTATWQRQALQVDPLDASGMLATGTNDVGEHAAQLASHDRLAMRVEGFGTRATGSEAFPCAAKRLYEVRSLQSDDRYAYLAACEDAGKETTESIVRHDAAARRVSSPLFDYVYLPNNQLVFESLVARDPKTGATYAGGADADLLLHLDTRGFFTMNFTNDNVQSFVEASHTGALGVASRIQFYLKLLFFKIDLKMATLVSYYADSANIPMVIDVPVDAPSRLHPGSGTLFGWLPKSARFSQAPAETTVPRAEPSTILRGTQTLAQQGLRGCYGERCRYRISGDIGDRPFTIDMSVDRFLVAKGFFPQWTTDVGRFKRDMDWDDGDDPKDKGKVALYFETSGLPKGQYKMDYWIRMGDIGEADGTCPRALSVTRVIEQPLAH